MNIDEIIHWLKEMQSPAISEAELYCAGSCYGQGDKAYPYPEDYALDEAINALEQLKEYRKLEEQGRLLKLPCKVGDMLYYPEKFFDIVVPVRLNEIIISFLGIDTYSYQYNCCSFDECGDVYQEYEFDSNDIGKTVFLTESEAEAKLKELRGRENE